MPLKTLKHPAPKEKQDDNCMKLKPQLSKNKSHLNKRPKQQNDATTSN